MHTGGTTRVLDVAGGTGDTAFRIAASAVEQCAPHDAVEVVVFDINPDMLAEGRRRLHEQQQGQGQGQGQQGALHALHGLHSCAVPLQQYIM